MPLETEKGTCLQAALVAALDRGDDAEALVGQLQGKVCRFTDALAARDARSAEATAQAKSELMEAENRATAAEVIVPLIAHPCSCAFEAYTLSMIRTSDL